MDEVYDFIVVGGGSAGCALAARLSEGGPRVLLLEAGGEPRSPWIALPVGYARLLGDARYNWMYRTEPEPALGGRVLDVPCGRTLGGTGSINGMLYVRGHRDDYDGWRDAGNAGWGYEDVLPWFRLSEANERGADAFHGADGPLAVTEARHAEPLSTAFVEAAVQAGHPRCHDFNGASQEGAGFYQHNIARGRRASTATAYLRPARRRPQLVVRTAALAERVLFDGGRACGVAYRHGGVQRTARARLEIVLAAGTFASPALLLRSGIGPAAQLARHGIAPRVELPGVGAGLQNHYRASLVVRCRPGLSLNDAMRSPWQRLRMGLQYALARSGPLAAGTLAGGFFRSSPTVPRPDLQVTFWNYSVLKRDARGLALHPFGAFTVNVVLLRPHSRGRVALTDADAATPPAIVYRHLAEPQDGATLAAGLRLVREMLAQPALAALRGEEIAPGAAVTGDRALEDYARTAGNSVFHPVGTCRMGLDPQAVVDAQLRVHGVAGLRVADASVMPSLVAGNTHAPTLMVAERAAQWMRAAAGLATPAAT